MSPTQLDLAASAAAYISARCDIPISDLDSKTRRAEVCFARNVVSHILRYQAGLTIVQIGYLLNRTHGAIRHNLRALVHDVETNPTIARAVASLIHEFSQRSASTIGYQLPQPSTPSPINSLK